MCLLSDLTTVCCCQILLPNCLAQGLCALCYSVSNWTTVCCCHWCSWCFGSGAVCFVVMSAVEQGRCLCSGSLVLWNGGCVLCGMKLASCCCHQLWISCIYEVWNVSPAFVINLNQKYRDCASGDHNLYQVALSILYSHISASVSWKKREQLTDFSKHSKLIHATTKKTD